MAVWDFGGRLYEVVSTHSGPDDAWVYEVTGLSGAPGTGPWLEVVIPDATPDGPFTPVPAERAFVRAGGGVVPWSIDYVDVRIPDSAGSDQVTLTMYGMWTIPRPVFHRFIAAVAASGDIIAGG
ncbi:hypothetical protein [Dactylosporangium sp. NPDC005555]|uniref:hypothetical protein n=1 Tax=Dactylosporangium sp. NPDC005555 TaxID=3154889 RepID=UPI0033A5B110